MRNIKKGVVVLIVSFNYIIGGFSQQIHIDLADAYEKKGDIELSDIATNFEFIKLETNENCLIGFTKTFVIDQDNLIIAYDAVYHFSTNGNFNKVLAKRGKGPEEYISFGGMGFSPDDNCFFLFDRGSHNLLKFELLNGTSESIKCGNSLLAYPLGSNKYCSYFPVRFLGLSDYYSINIHDDQGIIIDKLLKNSSSILDDQQKMSVHNCGLYNYKGGISIWDGYKSEVIEVFPNHKHSKKYDLNFGDKSMPERLKNNPGTISFKDEKNKYATLTSLIETEKYFFIECSLSGKIQCILFDKESGKGMSFPSNTALLYDGVLPVWPHGVNNDGKLYSMIQMNTLKHYFSQSEAQESKLKEIVEKSDDEDNPIILIYELKKED